MNDDDGLIGCGCLLGLVVALTFVSVPVALAWFIYDGYWWRGLPSDAAAAIQGTAHIVEVGNSREAAPHFREPRPQFALLVTLDNKSEYFVRTLTVLVNLKDKNSQLLHLESGKCQRYAAEDFRLSPGNRAAGWCAVSLSAKSAGIIEGPEYGGFDWYTSRARGHRAPIKLLKAPIDWIGSLFERVYD